jgi:putative ABC transport system permease protein
MREGLSAKEKPGGRFEIESGRSRAIKDAVREGRNGAMLGTIRQDVRFGLKLLWRDRAFALTAVLTVAICIAANTTIFTVVNSVLLKPLPTPDSGRILLMSNQYPNTGAGDSHNSGIPDYYDRLKYTNVFEDQAMFDFLSWTVPVNHVPLRLPGMQVTPSFFRILKVPPFLGRTFSEEEGLVENARKTIV